MPRCVLLRPKEVGSSSPAESLQTLTQKEPPQVTKGGGKRRGNGAFPHLWVCYVRPPFLNLSLQLHEDAIPCFTIPSEVSSALASFGCWALAMEHPGTWIIANAQLQLGNATLKANDVFFMHTVGNIATTAHV